jgi:hypothetical protein
MAFVDEVAQAAGKACRLNIGAFYGTAEGLGPGAGVILPDVTFPIFNKQSERFQARVGPALVLTHECDIEADNERAFNTEIVIAPLVLMSSFAQEFDTSDEARSYGRNLAGHISAGHVPRLSYLPPYLSPLDQGAFLYFNALSSSHVSQLGRGPPICALSEYGMGIVDNQLKNHLFRPKADNLPRLR